MSNWRWFCRVVFSRREKKGGDLWSMVKRREEKESEIDVHDWREIIY